jgi:uncharacterized protein YjdB
VPATAAYDVAAWSSSNAQIVIVDASGVVRANSSGATGTTQIRAAFGRVQATAPVTVHALVGSWGGYSVIAHGNAGTVTAALGNDVYNLRGR